MGGESGHVAVSVLLLRWQCEVARLVSVLISSHVAFQGLTESRKACWLTSPCKVFSSLAVDCIRPHVCFQISDFLMLEGRDRRLTFPLDAVETAISPNVSPSSLLHEYSQHGLPLWAT